jgi:Fe-S cluster assembly ATP-binding protein
MGHPAYEVTGGKVSFMDKDICKMDPHERAQAGLFLAFQYPKDISGVSLRNFLFAAYNAQMTARDPENTRLSPVKFKRFLEEKMEALHMDPNFADRNVNKGFSGGEKKKAEILQMHVLDPHLAFLDETDSGLDIDALRVVAEGINVLRTETPNQLAKARGTGQAFSALLVTHYARILDYIVPDHVHVMIDGNIVESGGADIAKKLEKEGYSSYL